MADRVLIWGANGFGQMEDAFFGGREHSSSAHAAEHAQEAVWNVSYELSTVQT
jgi:hypothetical protein